MSMPTTYTPPSADTIAATQNDDKSLLLLVAQRTFYSIAKRYLAVRLIGIFLIAIAAPIIGGLWPGLSVVCGAVAGGWIFVGRTWLTRHQSVQVDRGAAVQEDFDTRIFNMPNSHSRVNEPTLEDISRVTGTRAAIRRAANLEKLKDWYPLDNNASGATTVAICQRANVSYSDSLLKRTAQIWRGAIVVWGLTAIVVGISLHASLETFVLAIFLPLLPAFLDLVEFMRSYDSASNIRRNTASEIEAAIKSQSPIDPALLLVWQERIYELRRNTPLVPDVVYWAQRKLNERAMKAAANDLSQHSK